ncbi:MAG: hypothetical protein RR746_06395 [Lachnospiraceae bacterium]
MMLNPLINNQKNHYFKTIVILKYVVLIFSLYQTLALYKNLVNNEGFKLLFLIPLIFGLYFFFSNLKKYFLKNIPMTFFIIVLFFKYLITPFVIMSANNFSAMANGAVTSLRQQELGTSIMIYEMICIIITIEICIKFFGKEKKIRNSEKKAYNYPNTVLIISIFIGIVALFIFPQILQDFNFILVKEETFVSNRNTIITIFAYFSEFAQIFFFIVTVKICVYKKNSGKKYSTIALFLTGILNITLMWTANRMTIFLVAGTTLSILLYYFAEKKRIFLISILLLSVIMVILLSSYRLYGTVGLELSSDFADYFKLDKLSAALQTYFGGPDSVAGAVATKEYYGEAINGKTFLNDSFGAVQFIKQLPVFLNDRRNSTFFLFNMVTANGYNPGFIIPMAGQGYIYFGFFLSPIFSILSVLLLFLSERKAKTKNDVAYKYVFIYLTFNFALFPMYNYTLLMQNVFGRFIPLYMIIWLNKYIYFRKVNNKKERSISDANIC